MSDTVTFCCGCGILAGEQGQKILQLLAMNHSLKRACDEKDAEIAALRETVAGLRDVVCLGSTVMAILNEHGGAVAPHLRRFTEAINALEEKP